MPFLRLIGIDMADEASETFAGGLKNWLGALGFILPLAGVEELIRVYATGAVYPGWWWIDPLLIVTGLALYWSPAVFGSLRRRIKPKAAPEVRPATLPIAITKIKQPNYWAHSGLDELITFTRDGKESKQVEVDQPHLGINDVFISNISTNRSVTLRLFLVVTTKDGKSHKIDGSGRSLSGRTMGVNDSVTISFQKRGVPPPNFIVSPVTIGPQSTVRGSIYFLIDAYRGSGDEHDEKIIEFYVMGNVSPDPEARHSYALEIEDVMSGITISIPLPSDGYRGDP